MKLKQLINGGALAATVLTLGSARAEKNPYDGIVFCKATIVQPGSVGPDSVSVTLPFTTTGQTGLQYTWWNLGSVVAGGVADSWHSEGGPGRFVAHNNGRVGAYIYLTSSAYDCYAGRWNGGGSQGGLVSAGGMIDISGDDYWKIYGNEGSNMDATPSSSVQRWRNDEQHSYYCLAFTRDVEAKMPTWHMLNRSYAADRWWVGDDGNDEEAWYLAEQSECTNNGYVGAYMGYLDIGEHMPFDVKFWAPKRMRDPNSYEDRWTDAYGNAHFTFKVEAAAFPLWEHDVSVQ